MHRGLKRKLIIGGAVLAAVAFAGGAYAATQSSGSSTRQAFLNDVAKRLHVTPQQLTAALTGALEDQLQAAVKAGRLTQAQANAIRQRLQQGGLAPLGPFGLFSPPGPVVPLTIGPGYLSPGSFAAVPSSLGAAAGYLGLTRLQLWDQLAAGKSLAELAAAHGKSVSGLEQAMTAAFKARLDKLVAAKTMTAAQEQRLLSQFSARVSQEINRKGLLQFSLPRRQLRQRWFPGRPPTVTPIPPAGAPAPYAAPPAAAPVPPAAAPAPAF